MAKHTILFLAANPNEMDRRALDREARAIQVELERSGFRDHFELVTRWAAEPLDLLRELRKLKPTVVHFSGHGDHGFHRPHRLDQAPRRGSSVDVHEGEQQQGVFFQAADGSAQLVSIKALEETFDAAGPFVKLVVLNACYSMREATALIAHVDCVVGMSGSIQDDAARSFAIGFYGGLGEGESVADAYRQGRAAMSLEGLRDNDLPQLSIRKGVDAKRLVLTMVQPAAQSTPAQVEKIPEFALMAQPKTEATETLNVQSKSAEAQPTASSDNGPPAAPDHRGSTRQDGWRSRHSRRLWVGLTTGLCGTAVTLVMSGERSPNSPPAPLVAPPARTSPTNVTAQPRAGASVELAQSNAGALVESAQPGPGASVEPAQSSARASVELAQPRSGGSIESTQTNSGPVEPSHSPRRIPPDCGGADATVSMCSYRGTLRRIDGTPIANIPVELMGTDCIAITNKFGNFDFKECDPDQTLRLVNPSIFLHWPDGRICMEIPLERPPLATKIHIDLKTCRERVAAHAPAHQLPPLLLNDDASQNALSAYATTWYELPILGRITPQGVGFSIGIRKHISDRSHYPPEESEPFTEFDLAFGVATIQPFSEGINGRLGPLWGGELRLDIGKREAANLLVRYGEGIFLGSSHFTETDRKHGVLVFDVSPGVALEAQLTSWLHLVTHGSAHFGFGVEFGQKIDSGNIGLAGRFHGMLAFDVGVMLSSSFN